MSVAKNSEGTSPRAKVHVDLWEIAGCSLTLEAFTIMESHRVI